MFESEKLISFLQLRWIGQRRIVAYSVILAFASLVSLVWAGWEAMSPLGSDLLAFWSAGKLVVSGAASSVYDLHATYAVQSALGRDKVFAFVNPPPFLFFVAPLGLLSYPAAWIAWIGLTYAFWLAVSRMIGQRYVWPIAAFPGALMGAWHAQTGLLTSGLQTAAVTLLRKKPFIAGLCVGVLIIKPHLALLFPVAFIAGRHWRAFAGAALSTIGLVLLAWLVFGTDTMLDYRHGWAVSRMLIETGDADFFLRQTTVYAAVRAASTPLVAAVAQAIASLAVIVLTWKVWSGKGELEGKVAFMLAATPLATPYLFNYDLPFLIVPVIWLVQQARESASSAWERPMLLFFYLSPFVTRGLAMPFAANVMPWVLVWMLWEIWKRLETTEREPEARA